MNDTKFYIPFTKRNKVKQEVLGYATTEALDTQGEIVTRKAIEAALPNYMKFPTIREMHQWSAVGKTESASVDNKGLMIKAKIVDPIAWKKVMAGVYNGFSIGGKVVSKVGNIIKNLTLSEISVVDRPSNPETVFTLVKFDKEGKAIHGLGDAGWVKGYFDTLRKVV